MQNLTLARILLDCSLSENNAGFMQMPKLDPELIKTIDVVLLSHHETLLALPYISEFGGFKGQIYATDPTAMFGKLALEEFVKRFGCLLWFKESSSITSNPRILDGNRDSTRPCFSVHEARECVSKIKRVRFNEVFTVGPLTLTAISSGYCLGATNWMIGYHFQKILYLSTSSVTLNKHSAPLDTESLKSADFIIANNTYSASSQPLATRDALAKSSKTIYSNLVRAIETGGTVVFLCKPFGTLFDLLELMESMMGVTVVVHVVSRVANESLTVCNILGEWMNKERQDTVFGSNMPLGHGRMIATKRLIAHSSVHTVFSQKPQVLFLDYAELSNDMLSAVLKWRGDRCVYILPETDIPDNLNRIFTNARVNLLHRPFNLPATEQEYIQLIKSINPGLGVVIPQGTVDFNQLPQGTCCLVTPQETKGFEIPIDSKRRYTRVAKAVAENAEFIGGGDGACAGVSGVLELGEHMNTLREDQLGSMRKVLFAKAGLVERIADAALTNKNGIVVEKLEAGGVVIELDYGKLVFSKDGNVSLESADPDLLEAMWNPGANRDLDLTGVGWRAQHMLLLSTLSATPESSTTLSPIESEIGDKGSTVRGQVPTLVSTWCI
ncbi:UNVERIFIED_CONTAM: Integrator complex subunit 9 [Siphonaria sp. JEL0065]|nr:Integrator complex subunit 9 [Siphonaria sp. JEL0065]